MKRTLKLISLCLIAALLAIPACCFRATALSGPDAAQKGADVYSAWNIIHYDSYDYYVNEYTSPYRLWVDELQEDDSWNQLLLSWRIATFDVTSEYEYASKELGYYTTFLFNILYDSTTSSLESSFIQALSDGAGDLESSWKSIGVSTWSKVSETCKELTKDTILAEADPEQLKQLTTSLNNIEGISRALKSVNQIGDWLSYCTTAIDAVEKISKVEALLMCSDETAEIVQDLCRQADWGSPLYLVLDDFCTMLSGLLTPDMIKAILVGNAAADELCKEMTSMLWQETVSLAGSYGLILQAGQSVGKFTANAMFNTSSTIAEYYKLEAMYRLEDLIRAETISCQRSFESSPSAATAKKFIASYKLYCKTLLEGLDCSLSFFDAAMKEGLAAQISYWFNSDELDSIRSSISDIKRYLQESYDYMDTNSYNAYLYELEYLAESGLAQPPATEELQATPLPVVELDLPAVTEEIRADVFTLKSTTITENTTLTTDLETYGEMTVSSGTLDLNGHTLHVKNDFYLALDGELVLSGGQLIIDGNLYIHGYNYAVDLLGGKLTVAGDVLHSNGYITLNKGSMTVCGDYRMQSISTNSAQETVYTTSHGKIYLQYEEDFLRIEGDWICNCDFPSSFPPTCTAGRIELLGDWKNMSYDGPSCSGTNTLALLGTGPQQISLDSPIANLEVGEGTDVTWSGYLDVDRLTQDAAFSSNGAIITSINLDRHTLDIKGDVTIGGDVNCLDGALKIDGNLLHSGGTITLNKGTMTVSGDYRMQGISTNSAQETVYTTSYGKISMEYEEDLLRIEGNWICDCDTDFECTAGRIELLGDWENFYGPFFSGSHTLALVGTGPQRISLYSSYNDVIANLEVGEGADVTLSGYLYAAQLTQDCAITSDGAIITSINLDGHTLDITGDVTIGGHVNCLNGSLVIDGNLLHSGGTITLNKGAMTVSGDYRMQSISTNSAQETIYVSGSGSLVMQYEEDSLQVDGDMYIQGSSNTLKGGTLGIRGNFTHISGSFAPSGNHTTVLNGTGDRQVITFSGSSSRFNILELTRDGTYYLFSPDPCWNTLKESEEVSDIPVTNLSISARAKTLTAGQQYQLTAVVSPAAATDPSLRWSSSQEEVATVDDTGLVTAVAPGSAVIRVDASNGLYRTCTITVNEIFSGILEVGSCGALPGEQLRLPVRVYDNPGFAAMRVSLEYDPALLTPVEVVAGPILSSGELTCQLEQKNCEVLWYDTQDMEQDGILFYIVFQVSPSAQLGTEASVTLSSAYGDICQADHTDISFTTEPGTISIQEIRSGDLYEDGQINVHDILLMQHYLTGLEELSGRQLAAADLDDDGTVSMKDIVRLAQILLGINESPDGLAMQSEDSITISVSDGVFDSDGYVEVPVVLSGCSGIAGLRLQLDYDSNQMELIEVRAVSELLEETLCTNLSDPSRTSTWITWYDALDQDLNGPMFILRFRLSTTSFSGITPVSVKCGVGDICTAALKEPSIQTGYGIIHTADYPYQVQPVDIVVNSHTDSASLQGTLICGENLQGTQATLFMAAYRNGRLETVWDTPVTLKNGKSFTMEGQLPTDTTMQLFILSNDGYQPLCPKVYP